MMSSRLARRVTLVALAVLLSGCKIALMAVDNGDIETESGRYTCLEGNNCVIEINDTFFTETFVAKPKLGYYFSHWLEGNGFLCQGSTKPVCVVDNIDLFDNEAALEVIASDAVFYLLPVFVAVQSTPAPPGPVLLPDDVQAKYDEHCVQCHETGVSGAPISHDEAAWAEIIDQPLTLLVGNVINGVGAMPPRGGCNECDGNDLRQIIDFMAGPAPD